MDRTAALPPWDLSACPCDSCTKPMDLAAMSEPMLIHLVLKTICTKLPSSSPSHSMIAHTIAIIHCQVVGGGDASKLSQFPYGYEVVTYKNRQSKQFQFTVHYLYVCVAREREREFHELTSRHLT